MATTNGNKSDWITLLQEANTSRADKIPPGYMLRRELIKKFGISPAKFDRDMPILLEAGKFVVGYYKRLDSAGRLLRQKHFKKR